MDLTLKETYEEIASEFNTTRRTVWPCVQTFLKSLESDSKLLEVGCGNGKNLLFRKDLKCVGIDFCEKFIEICKSKSLEVYQQDMRKLKFDDNTFDNVICIATLHHLESRDERLGVIKEIIRVLKKNGKAMILVWAKAQDKKALRKFKSNDEMVPWINKNGKKYLRYYHLYNKYELELEILDIKVLKNEIELSESIEENGNYGIIFKKI